MTKFFLACTIIYPDWVASHFKDHLCYPSIRSLMASPTGQLQSQCAKSCSPRRHDGQTGSITRSVQWRYWCRKRWWMDCNLAKSTLSCQFLICLELREAFRCWYIYEAQLWVGELSQILLLITCRELERDRGRMVFVTMVGASLAALLAS